ncbi:U3-containing 90S pre-ribosomal complex subunit-domain containing protein [Podospora australis]|uniref:U3-containing 90S pre-ribosomal complex subunit-domain containing protein n=1 Tax=Podospora australis TaxID=1536484 RepID=A0AAN6X3B1_9PEZI|nr:U3-containing 90S pre-ribosomal complex subunit-domain containing protein [Podospora australis]
MKSSCHLSSFDLNGTFSTENFQNHQPHHFQQSFTVTAIQQYHSLSCPHTYLCSSVLLPTGNMAPKTQTKPQIQSKKRKLEDDAPAKEQKKQKKKQREDEADLDVEAGLNKSFARMDGQLLADHIAQKTSRFGTDLSPVELSDLYISANAIKDTTSFQKPRTLENLPDFLQEFAREGEKLDQTTKDFGAPHTLVVSGAGLRAADAVRALRTFQKKGNTIGKLFAKHFKVEEQVAFLKKTRSGLAVGTPQRLIDLLENGALSIAKLRRIVVDASHIDQKKRGVLDMRETLMPLVKLLTRKELKEKYTDEEQPIDLIFY